MADRPVEVIVIDDHPVVGDGLVLVLGYEGITCRPVAPASPEQAVEEAVACGASLALLDLDLGWVGATGLDLIVPLQDLNAIDVKPPGIVEKLTWQMLRDRACVAYDF